MSHCAPTAAHADTNAVRDLHIVARRDEGGKRTTFYGICRCCGWQSVVRSTTGRVEKDWAAHVAEKANRAETRQEGP